MPAPAPERMALRPFRLFLGQGEHRGERAEEHAGLIPFGEAEFIELFRGQDGAVPSEISTTAELSTSPRLMPEIFPVKQLVLSAPPPSLASMTYGALMVALMSMPSVIPRRWALSTVMRVCTFRFPSVVSSTMTETVPVTTRVMVPVNALRADVRFRVSWRRWLCTMRRASSSEKLMKPAACTGERWPRNF